MGSRQRRLGAAVAVVVTFTSADGVALVGRIYGDGAPAIVARFSSRDLSSRQAPSGIDLSGGRRRPASDAPSPGCAG